MKDHGELEDAETAQVLGALVIRAVEHLRFCTAGAQAKANFSIDGVAYEITVEGKPA